MDLLQTFNNTRSILEEGFKECLGSLPGIGDNIGESLQNSALSLTDAGGEVFLLMFLPPRLAEDDKVRQVWRPLHLLHLGLDNVRLCIFLDGVVTWLRYFQLFLAQTGRLSSVLHQEGVQEETLRETQERCQN